MAWKDIMSSSHVCQIFQTSGHAACIAYTRSETTFLENLKNVQHGYIQYSILKKIR